MDPLIGVAIGVWWMGESASTGPAVLAGELLAAVIIVGGIAVLSWRNSHPAKAEAVPAVSSPAFGWPARQ